jgi:hypothetical protein
MNDIDELVAFKELKQQMKMYYNDKDVGWDDAKIDLIVMAANLGFDEMYSKDEELALKYTYEDVCKLPFVLFLRDDSL